MVAVAAAVVASCCFITPAFAGNVGKTSWSAYLTGWNTADTPNRQKQDASNGYIKADHVSGDRTIRAWMLGYANEDVESVCKRRMRTLVQRKHRVNGAPITEHGCVA